MPEARPIPQPAMPSNSNSSQGFLARAWLWFKDQIVREVPPESAICEFDCRNGQCRNDEWATCERRLSRGAGEFMPEQRVTLRPPDSPGAALAKSSGGDKDHDYE